MTDAAQKLDLHPMSLGEILDRTVQLYRSRFLLFVGVAAAPSAVVLACLAIGVILYRIINDGSSFAAGMAALAIFAVVMVGLLFYAAACGLGYAALCDAASKRLFHSATTIRETCRNALRRGWYFLGLFGLDFLILAVAPGVVFLLCTIGLGVISRIGGFSDTAGAVLGMMMFALFVLFAVYILWMLPRLCLAFPVCVVENAGAIQSIRRGWSISEGTRGRILLLFLLGSVTGMMLTWVVTIPAVIVIALIPGLNSSANSQLVGQITVILMYAASFAVQALVRPIYGIGLTLFYYDQRIRKEGFDIEWMMQAAGLEAPAMVEPAVTKSMPFDVANHNPGEPA